MPPNLHSLTKPKNNNSSHKISPDQDRHWLLVAATIAKRAQGTTAPNPCVGCVVVSKDGCLLAAETTAPKGRPHAEALALARAREQFGDHALIGSVVYVTLEPCAHWGKTPPCVQAIIEAKAARVVIGTRECVYHSGNDGISVLRAAGVHVDVGEPSIGVYLTNICSRLHRAHQLVQSCSTSASGSGGDGGRGGLTGGLTGGDGGGGGGGDDSTNGRSGSVVTNDTHTRRQRQRPLISIKLATGLDGTLSLHGKSRWITGEDARTYGQWLRASHDAIMIGRGTLHKDQPYLTVRSPLPHHRTPTRIVLVHRDEPTQYLNSLKEHPHIPTFLVYGDSTVRQDRGNIAHNPHNPDDYHTGTGILDTWKWIAIQRSPSVPYHLDEDALLTELVQRGITSILVEGGAKLITQLLKKELVDTIYWFRSMLVLGANEDGDLSGRINQIHPRERIQATQNTPLDNAPLSHLKRWKVADHRFFSSGDVVQLESPHY